MYDPTFHMKTLRNEITYGDKLRNNHLFSDHNCETLIEEAIQRVRESYIGLSIKSHSRNGSNVHALHKLSDELVLRKITRNIRQVTQVRQSNRSSIVRCIRSLCEEGVTFKLYKLDIKEFYASISPNLFLSSIVDDSAFPPATTRLLSSFFDEMKKHGIEGLPRGLSLSSVLSEYVMRRFDHFSSNLDGVFFYSRFVDDMVFITRGTEDHTAFISNINANLPQGLICNRSKTKCVTFRTYEKGIPIGVEGEIDFLGYNFRISFAMNKKGRVYREVQLDIARKKVKRIKSRLCLSFAQFIRTRNFRDLENRIRMLTGNYSVSDINTNRTRNVGIYYSYHLIDSNESDGLKQLDAFYKKMVLSNSGKICSTVQHLLSSSQKSQLLRYSFRGGFCSKTHFSLHPHTINTLRKCWNNA